MELIGYNKYGEYLIRMGIDGFIIIENYKCLDAVSGILYDYGILLNDIVYRLDVIELQEEKQNSAKIIENTAESITIADIKKLDN